MMPASSSSKPNKLIRDVLLASSIQYTLLTFLDGTEVVIHNHAICIDMVQKNVCSHIVINLLWRYSLHIERLPVATYDNHCILFFPAMSIYCL